MNKELDDIEEIEHEDEVQEKFLELDLIVDKGQDLLRIDKFLVNKMMGVTRTKIQAACETELILVNGKQIKANYKVHPEDHILVYSYREPSQFEIVPENIPLDIFYEDEDMMVINKPPNMVVHPGNGNPNGTLVNAMAYYLQQKNTDKEALDRIGLVHRIDKDTSGLLLFGKTDEAVFKLSEQFKNHSAKREYVALVWGNVEEDEGTIDVNIGRHQQFRKKFEIYPEADFGKTAITHYKVLERFNYTTLISCKLETGRTHQIRVHMKSIGHTLFNDRTYGGEKILKGTVYTKYKQFVDNCFKLCPRQALHAKTIGFVHPRTGKEMMFESNLPEDIIAMIEKWRSYSVR